MNRRLSILIAGVVNLAMAATVYADDFCDQAFVTGLLVSFEAEEEYTECKLSEMVSTHTSSSVDLIELLTSLKDDYEASNTANGDGSTTNTDTSHLDLEPPLTLAQTGSDIDLDADGGLDKLRNWAAGVISSIEPQKKDIMNLQHSSTTEIVQLQCEVTYQWRKLHTSRNRILICVGQLENAGSD